MKGCVCIVFVVLRVLLLLLAAVAAVSGGVAIVCWAVSAIFEEGRPGTVFAASFSGRTAGGYS